MNSLLNIALREKHGLVYTAESTVFNYTEAGIWSIYFGCDENDVSKCHRLILNQLDRLTDKPLGESQLARAKRQMTGQMHLASDNFENYALALGKFYARTGKHRDIEASCKAIMELTATDLLNTAQEIFRPEPIRRHPEITDSPLNWCVRLRSMAISASGLPAIRKVTWNVNIRKMI